MIWNFLFVCCCLQSLIVNCLILNEDLRKKLMAPSQDTASSHSKIYKIYSKATGGFVQIRGRRVNANGNEGSRYVKIKISSVGYGGRIILRGVASGRYLCINKKGRLQAKRKKTGKRCMFQENMTYNYFDTFTNVKNRRWFIGFQKKNGKPKRAQRTSPGQNAVMFLKQDFNRTPRPTSASSLLNPAKWKILEFRFRKKYFRKTKSNDNKMMGDDPHSFSGSSYIEEELARRKKLAIENKKTESHFLNCSTSKRKNNFVGKVKKVKKKKKQLIGKKKVIINNSKKTLKPIKTNILKEKVAKRSNVLLKTKGHLKKDHLKRKKPPKPTIHDFGHLLSTTTRTKSNKTHISRNRKNNQRAQYGADERKQKRKKVT